MEHQECNLFVTNCHENNNGHFFRFNNTFETNKYGSTQTGEPFAVSTLVLLFLAHQIIQDHMIEEDKIKELTPNIIKLGG